MITESEISELKLLKACMIGFSELSDDKFIDIFKETKKVHIKAGAEIYTEGKKNEFVYIIAKGEAEILKLNKPINQVKKGAVLGEMSLIGIDKSSATVVALNEIEAFRFKKHIFERLLNRYDEINRAVIVETLSRKIQQTETG
jgi:CRP-like cAMP-binding protein